MTREPFVMIPTALLYADLDDSAVRAWAILDDAARRETAVTVTVAMLARVLRCSTRRARELLADLEAAGFLARDPRPGKPSALRPLRRPRPVHNPVNDPGTQVPGSHAGPRHTRAGVGPLALSTCAREEEEAEASISGWRHDPAGDASRRPAWCGSCDPRTRLTDDDRPQRCPTCHPLIAPPF